MVNKQQVRNSLCEIEDRARKLRNESKGFQTAEVIEIFNLIAALTQIVREKIVQ